MISSNFVGCSTGRTAPSRGDSWRAIGRDPTVREGAVKMHSMQLSVSPAKDLFISVAKSPLLGGDF